MAEENTDITKDSPAKEPSGSSPLPTHTAVPSPDAVVQAFASFEKEHENHATIQATPPPPPKETAPQIKPPSPPAPVVAKPTVVPTPPAPTPVPPTPVVAPAPIKVAIPQFIPAPEIKPTSVAVPTSSPIPQTPTPPPTPKPIAPPPPAVAKPVSPQVSLPKVTPAPIAPAPTQPIRLVPPPPVSAQPVAVPIPPPPPAVAVPIVPKQTASVIVPPAPTQSTPPSPVNTPTPIVTTSFPIAPIASIQKPAVPVQPAPQPSNPPAFSQPKVAPASTPATTEQKVPQTPAEGVASATTPKVKPVQPTMVESLRAQSTSALHPLRTLRSDVEDSVKEHKTSMVTVAAAEENRRANKVQVMPLNDPAPPRKKSTMFLVVSALVLLVLGGGLLVFAFMPAKEVPIAGEPQLPASTLIFADETIPLPLAGHNRTSVMSELVKMRENTSLSIGLIREIYPTKMATSTNLSERAEIISVLHLLAPHANDEFLRTLNQKYILGVHVFDGNQAFLIVTTSSYEQTFVGMVEWEQDMLNDLLPLFDRRPRPRTPDERLSTTTAPFVINTGFTDMVIENHDARALKDSDGNVVLLWTFINQNTLAITTNERTLAELVSRIRSAPTLGL